MKALGRLVWLAGLPCLLVLVSWRTISCPYTKVEESFTIQAVHDVLSYGISPNALARYDHQVFPGAVPRSFIGPLLLAAISYPFILLSRTLGAVQTSADVQTVVRLGLAAVNATAVAFFGQQCFSSTIPRAQEKAHSKRGDGRVQAVLFLLITAVQFHFGFWAGRTIPNSIALPFVTIAMALVCRNIGMSDSRRGRTSSDARTAIWLLTFSAVVLRLETVATLIPVGLYLLATGQILLGTSIKMGFLSSVISVLLTTIIDTYFWQDSAQSEARSAVRVFASSLRSVATDQRSYPFWPELHAVLFNVVEGKSSEWGVSPWHAYVTSLIPKLLAFTAPFILLGAGRLLRGRKTATEARARFLLLTAITHVAILSMLGHKEWRFVFYILPGLNVVAAIGASVLIRTLPGKAILAALIALQVALNLFTGYLSAINYPGGHALKALHEHIEAGNDAMAGGRPVIHIDVLPAMTGVTLFQSLHLDRNRSSSGALAVLAGVLPATCEPKQCWTYDKTENLPTTGPEAARVWSTFTHLITEVPECRILQAESGAVLAESLQLFEPIGPPMTSFNGLRRKSIPQIKSDLLSLPEAIIAALKTSRDLATLIRLALPVTIVEEPAIWLCRRKLDST